MCYNAMPEQFEIVFTQINIGHGTTSIKLISRGAHDNPAPTLSAAGSPRRWPAGKRLL